MAEPRLSSPGRNLPAFQTDSEKNPNGFHTPRVPSGTRDGYGRGRGEPNVVPLREAWSEEIEWAEQHLPDEHTGFVCVAIGTMRGQGKAVSTKSVLAHLEATGRDRKSTDALARRLAA